MKKLTISVIAAAALALAGPVAAQKTTPVAQPTVPAPHATESLQSLSAWTNQLGSTLYIDSIDASGKLTGHYINRAPGYGCQNIPYPVTGWVYGTAITFTTQWQSTTESCNSITAWTGFYYQGQIQTLWQLVANGSTNLQQIRQGSDTFVRTSKTEKKSLLPSAM